MIGRLAFVGLTGGIGSGKSTVARLIAERGIPVLDADQLARQVTEPGQPAHAEIAAAFPDVIGADGRLDRRALSAHVFAHADARRRLERITHPQIQQRAMDEARRLEQAGHRLAVYEASLLVETGRHKDFDGLIVVTAPEALRIARAVVRDGRPEADIRARIAAQMATSDKLKAATHVIDNGGDLVATARQVDDLLIDLRRRFGDAADPA